ERGFSFYHDGPLDMRMDQSQEFKASDIINQWSEDELVELFREYGEIYKPYRVVNEIVKRRETKPFETTMELSLLIERTFGWRTKGKHPATNFFLALRLEVNQELTELHSSLLKIITHALRPKGRLMVISFHSTEDRIVKKLFKSSTHLGLNLTKKVIAPERSEILLNPRSRSAKLRVFQREDLNEPETME
ncbi:MAG: 16S rRNA (cytosine(1402)-N(4))-methyltransferase RsmH, partial [Bdellovibrionales bacterium]|nr:16S rRNA (cytosine(1402)-N(4))-methyltransferase RsmH [Bdellovibrionales bacterium]